MDYTKIEQHNKDIVIHGIKNFSPAQILDCGQCFRWEADKADDPREAGNKAYIGIAHGRQLRLRVDGDTLVFTDMNIDEYERIWKDYFDLSRSYSAVLRQFSHDPSLAKATAFSPGLRLMRQDPWETLVTFVLSQNSNIPRIKKMVAALCAHFGEALTSHACITMGGWPNLTHAFPTPEALASLSPEALAPIKPGYRAPYIIDAARQVSEGKICLTTLQSQPTQDIKKALMQIHGVGPKVAECVLLFGFGRVETCPMDVWMKRVMSSLYPSGFPEKLQPTAGIAQQYLFHYARNFPEVLS